MDEDPGELQQDVYRDSSNAPAPPKKRTSCWKRLSIAPSSHSPAYTSTSSSSAVCVFEGGWERPVALRIARARCAASAFSNARKAAAAAQHRLAAAQPSASYLLWYRVVHLPNLLDPALRSHP